jgi:multicomponent K+:H+ antiporter subunit G
MWTEALVSFFILAGGVFTLLGSIGLARLPDFYCRLHAPTKATTLGVGSMRPLRYTSACASRRSVCMS